MQSFTKIFTIFSDRLDVTMVAIAEDSRHFWDIVNLAVSLSVQRF
jgi:hypothetical protein